MATLAAVVVAVAAVMVAVVVAAAAVIVAVVVAAVILQQLKNYFTFQVRKKIKQKMQTKLRFAA